MDPQGPNGAPHGPPHGFPPGGYNQPSQYGPGGNDYNYQPGYQRQEQEEEDSGLDKMGLALGGLIAAGGTAAAIYAYNVKTKFRLLYNLMQCL